MALYPKSAIWLKGPYNQRMDIYIEELYLGYLAQQ